MGMFDSLGGMFGGNNGSLYGLDLDPQTRQAIAARGLLSAAGAFGQAAMPSRMPIPLGAALGSAAAAMGEGQDAALMNALRAQLLGFQGKNLESQLEMRKAFMGQNANIGNALNAYMNGQQGGTAEQPQAQPAVAGQAAEPEGAAREAEAPPSEGGGGWGPLASDVVDEMKKAGASDAFIQGALANGLAEGGFKQPWNTGDSGTSFGHWQLHEGGELGGFRQFAGNASDSRTQAQYLIQRMQEIAPGILQTNDPKAATDAIQLGFEKNKGARPGQRYGYLATAMQRFPGAPAQTASAQETAPDINTGMFGTGPVTGLDAARQALGTLPGPGAAAIRLAQNGPMPSIPSGGPSPAAISQGAVPPPAQPQTLGPQAAQQMAPITPPAQVSGPNANATQRLLMALGLADSSAAAAGIGNPYQGLMGVIQNSPTYKAAVAAEAKKAELPYTLGTARAGSAMTQGGRITGFVPTLQQTVDANGNRVFAYMTPQGTVPTGQTAALGPQQTAFGSKTGEIAAENAPPLTPSTTTSTPAGAPKADLGGSPIAKGLVSTLPDYSEPTYSAKDLDSKRASWTADTKDLIASLPTAQAAEIRLQDIADAFKMIQTGAYTEDKAGFNSKLKAIFGDSAPQFANANPADVEKALHANYRATLNVLSSANKRFTQNEFAVTSQTSEHSDLQPEANLQMLGEDIGQLRQLQAMGNDWVNALQNNKRDFDTFKGRWLNQNPMSKIVPAMKDEIGPLKGMPGNPSGKPAAEAAIPPIRRVVDGVSYFSPDGGKTWYK